MDSKCKEQTYTTKKSKTQIVVSAVYSGNSVLLSTAHARCTGVCKTGCIVTSLKMLTNSEGETKFPKWESVDLGSVARSGTNFLSVLEQFASIKILKHCQGTWQ